MKDSLNIAIAGATGYVGLELIKYYQNIQKLQLSICVRKNLLVNQLMFLIKELKKEIYLKFLKLKKLIGIK